MRTAGHLKRERGAASVFRAALDAKFESGLRNLFPTFLVIVKTLKHQTVSLLLLQIDETHTIRPLLKI